jgi:hypothetical protein
MVPIKNEVDEGGCLVIHHSWMMDGKGDSKNACCVTKKFCDCLLGGQNLQFDDSNNLFLCCALEEQQRDISLFDESLVWFAGLLFDSIRRIQVELEACRMGDKGLRGQSGMGGFQYAKIDT